jgi:hypothetical protein
MNNLSHEEYVAQQRSRAVDLAKGILAGELNVLEAAWELAALRKEVGISGDDPDFAVFSLIQDDTEHLPIGEQRKLWSTEALASKSAEVAEREAWAREDSKSACLNIIARGTAG